MAECWVSQHALPKKFGMVKIACSGSDRSFLPAADGDAVTFVSKFKTVLSKNPCKKFCQIQVGNHNFVDNN